MRTAYVLMYKETDQFKPYAVFEDSITAERMKRDGDEIIKVPYFRNDCPDHLVITDKDLEGVPLNGAPWKITYQSIPCKDSTIAPPDYDTYPKVTCNKTIDEHTWRDRVD